MKKFMKKCHRILILLTLFLMVSCSRNVEIKEKSDVINVESNEETTEAINEDMDKYKITYLRDFEGYELGYNLDNDDDIYQIVDINEKVGFIDSNGNIVVKPQYDYAYQYGDIIDVSDKENEYDYFVNFKGEVVLDSVNGRKMYTAVGIDDDLEENYFIVSLYNEDGSVENKNYIIDSKGNIKYETEENYGISPFLHVRGVCYVVSMDSNFNSYDKVEFIMSDGSPVPESDVERYTDIFNNYMTNNKTFEDGTYFVAEGKEERGFDRGAIADKYTGELITGYDFRQVTIEMVGKNFVVEKFEEDGNLSLCIIDNKGNIIKNMEDVQGYNAINSLGDYFSLSFYIGKASIFDEKGNLVKETNYDGIYKEYDGTIKIVNENGEDWDDSTYGYLSEDLEEMLPPEYDQVTGIYNNTALVVKDNKLYRFDINN